MNHYTRYQKEKLLQHIKQLQSEINIVNFDNLPRDFSMSTDLLLQFSYILQELMTLSRESDNFENNFDTTEYYSIKYNIFRTIFMMFQTSTGHKLNRLYPQLRKDLDIQRKELLYKLDGIDDKKMQVLKDYLQSYT